MTDYIIALDCGQSVDYSAAAVLRRCWWRDGQRADPDTARLWHKIPTLLRWPLGTPYPMIVQAVVELYGQFEALCAFGVKLVVDAGGPGRPVIDLFKERKLRPVGITITGGETAHDKPDNTITVPKRDICSALVVASQSGDVVVQAGGQEELAEELARELEAFGYTIRKKTGKQAYESIVEEVHDDLVVAVAMGLYFSTVRLPRGFPNARDRGATVEDTDYDWKRA